MKNKSEITSRFLKEGTFFFTYTYIILPQGLLYGQLEGSML